MMPGMPREEGLPPEIREMLKQRAAVIEAMQEAEIEQRRTVLAHAWLLCTCRPWPEPGCRTPPQDGCVVHGSVMITLDGRVL